MAHDVMMPVQSVELPADIEIPQQARGVIVFAHGTGSSRHSPRNRMVAERLRGVGFGTVLADLLTEVEERTESDMGEYRFDIARLTARVRAICERVSEQPETSKLPLGLFGASTGAAAALCTAAQRPDLVRAVVSRGGRPDLAGPMLSQVRAPTLLIVGGIDTQVADLNRAAQRQLGGPNSLWIVPGATHLFPEPGALEQVAGAAGEWFDRHLAGGDLAVDGYP